MGHPVGEEEAAPGCEVSLWPIDYTPSRGTQMMHSIVKSGTSYLQDHETIRQFLYLLEYWVTLVWVDLNLRCPAALQRQYVATEAANHPGELAKSN